MFPLLLSSMILTGIPYLLHHNLPTKLNLLHADTANETRLPLHVPLPVSSQVLILSQDLALPNLSPMFFQNPDLQNAAPKPCCTKLSSKSSPGQSKSKTSLNQLSPCHHGPKPTSSQPKLKFCCPKPNPKSNPTLPKSKSNPTQHNQKPSPTQPSTKGNPEQPNQIPRPYQPSLKSSPNQPGKHLALPNQVKI